VPRAPLSQISATLVTGATLEGRESLIAAHLPAGVRSAVILEGLPSGSTVLYPTDTLDVYRVAQACLCCTGNLVLRVTLNRILRSRPGKLFIGVADTAHLDQLRSWLQQAPYDQLLIVTPDLILQSRGT
jgi:hypothetical protein